MTLNLSSKVIGDFNNEANFPHKLLLTSTQVSRLRKAFSNRLSGNTKFSKTQLSKTVLLGGFPGRLFGPLINVLTPSDKSVLMRL